MAKCCICKKGIEREDAPVLTMGGVGNARLLCDGCAELLDVATEGREYAEIKEAIENLTSTITSNDPDGLTFSTVSSLLIDASKRAKAIKEGSYDFSLDETEGEDFDEIPEELLESEEDIEKDKADEEKNKKFDKVYNYVLIGVCIGFAIFVIWKILDLFVL